MNAEPDRVLDDMLGRQRLRRWQAGAVAVFAVALVTLLAVGKGDMRSGAALVTGPHLAQLKVHGIIRSDVSRWTKALERASGDPSVKGLVLDIDSPGGAVTGGEELHDAIERFARVKPVVATMRGMGASAGYMIAVPARRIFAERATLTGSIGVLMESPDVSGLLDRIGVTVNQLTSGPMKGQPSVVRPISPEGKVMLQGVVNDLFGQFVAMVVAGRHMPEDKVRSLADGRPYTGQQAVALGLVDSLGTPEDARVWLAQTCGLPKTAPLEVIGGVPQKFWSARHMIGQMTGAVLSQFGLSAAQILPEMPEGIDGAVSIWKP